MEKKWLEIGVSTGLVLLMMIMMMAVQQAAPAEFRSPGVVLVMLLFMASMGLVGIKLLDM